jgi:hypothetical protein
MANSFKLTEKVVLNWFKELKRRAPPGKIVPDGQQRKLSTWTKSPRAVSETLRRSELRDKA